MNTFNKKNKIIIIIVVSIIFSLGIYFVYSKTDETQIFSYEDGIENNIVENNTKEETKVKTEEKNKIVVHITGSIANEGILELDENSRISDAIEKAGGLIEGADVSQINLAFVLSDGMKIYIPNVNDKEEQNKNEDKTGTYITKESGVSTIIDISSPNSNINVNTQTSSGGTKVNINTADITKLCTLPGIGDSTAQKIIDYRNENGKFNSIEDIKNVKGIGDSKFEKIKDFIVIK